MEGLGAGAHVGEAVAGSGGGREAGAVVGDFDGEVCGGRCEAEFEFGGAGVFDDVVDGFADDEEELMAEGGREVAGFDLLGEVEAAAEVGGLREVGDLRGEVGEEVVEAVLFGIDGPDDFIEGSDGFAGGFGEAIELWDVATLREGDVGEEADLGEAGADLIVHVAGDAGALGFDGGLAAEGLGVASITGAGDAVADEDDERGGGAKREGAEPGGLVAK